MESIEFLNQVKQQVLVALLADDELGERLVLKGGNLLQFAYQLSVRASKDIDISVDGDFEDSEFLSKKVQTCLEQSFRKNQLVIFDFKFHEVPAKISDELKSFWGGYQCEFKLVDKSVFEDIGGDLNHVRKHALRLDTKDGTKFKIDFSRHEFCGDKEEFIIDGYTIFGYSPRMFVAEKIRALCQQMPEYAKVVHRNRLGTPRARDFVDIRVIMEHYGVNFDDADFHEIVKKIFTQKRVPLDWIGKIKNYREQHENNFWSVKDTVHPSYDLQEFGFYFDFVCKQCARLESLWRE